MLDNETVEQKLARVEAELANTKAQPKVVATPPVQRRREVEPPARPVGKLTREQELEAYANDLARENLLLTTAAENGLTVEELSVLEFNTPTELKLAARVLKMENESRALGESIREQSAALSKLQTAPPPAGEADDDRVDTGGRTRTQRVQAKKDEFEELAKKSGKTPAGRYARLEAIRRDPSKVLTGASEEE